MTAAFCTPRGISRIREKITLLALYHSGVLSKKYPAEQYTKQLELRDLKAMQKVGSEFGWSVYSAQRGASSEGQASGPDAEEWRGYILAVTKMEIPKKMSLLPGQMMRLEVVIKEECKRTSLSLKEDALGAPCRTNSNIMADLPSCFYNVTRQEAAQMLEAEPEWGDIILRPSTDSNGYAVTMRRIISGDAVIRHYKVQPSNCGFVLQLEVTVPSLNGVVLHFVKQTGLQPFVKPQHYYSRIEVCGTQLDITAGSLRLQQPPVPPRNGVLGERPCGAPWAIAAH